MFGTVVVSWAECNWSEPHPPHTWQSVEDAVVNPDLFGIGTKMLSCTGAGTPEHRCESLCKLTEDDPVTNQCVYAEGHLGVHLSYRDQQMMIWPVPPMKERVTP